MAAVLSIRVSDDLYASLGEAATSVGLSRNQLVKQILAERLGEDPGYAALANYLSGINHRILKRLTRIQPRLAAVLEEELSDVLGAAPDESA